MHGRALSLLIAALVVVVIVVMAAVSASRYDTFASGLWVGDPGFLAAAKLQDMQLFIAPAHGGVRRGYVIITDATGAITENQAFELRLRSPARRLYSALRASLCTTQDVCELAADFKFDTATTQLPARAVVALSMLDGTMTVHAGGRVYAFLEKDLTASAAAVAVFEQPDSASL